MTFSSLCEYLDASPVRQRSILSAQKYPTGGPVRSYSTALSQITEFAINGTPLAPQAEGLETWEREIVDELWRNDWRPPAPQVRRPSTHQAPMNVNGVDVSVYPDLLLADPQEGRPRTGALKFYFRKTKPLSGDVGRWMASFLYRYKIEVERDETASPDLCLIYDVRNDQYFEAGKSHKRLFANVEAACLFIAGAWNSI
jgi:hypothetical protein